MRTLAFLLCTATAFAEVHTMTLRQALERALTQNPDVVLARLEALKGKPQTEQSKDLFSLKLGAGSGLAYTYGFPSSIDGNAPSAFQARAQMGIFNRPQYYRVLQSQEAEKGLAVDVSLKQDEVAYNVASAFLDAEQAARSAAAAERQYQSLLQVKQFTDVRVSEGRELGLESQRANVNALAAMSASQDFAYAGANAENALAELLGYPAGDQVRPALEDRTVDAVLTPQEQAIASAVAESLELRRLQSNLTAKQLEVKSFEASRLPRVNLVGNYSVLTKFNNFLEFYPRFQRNNFQIGASIEIPIFVGKAPGAGKAIAQTDIEKIETEIARTKNRIANDIQDTYRSVERAENLRNLRRAQLDFARDEISVKLAQYDEGRATMAEVEAARASEQDAWIRYYDAQHTVEVARLNVRRTTGTILAGVR